MFTDCSSSRAEHYSKHWAVLYSYAGVACQNESPTYFLVSLLAALLVLNVASFWLLPRRVVQMSTREVEELFRGERLIMGWLGASERNGQVYTLGVVKQKT